MKRATNLTSLNPVGHLDSASLNARARRAAATINAARISLRDHEGTAYEAARFGCAHLGFVETLEAAVKRAARLLTEQGAAAST